MSSERRFRAEDASGIAAGDASARPGSRLHPFSVSDVNGASDAVLKEAIGAVWVRGEVSRFLAHGSGHWYFTIKDAQAAVSCAMFRSRNQSVRPHPRDGEEFLLLAAPGVYSPQGRYQLIVQAMERAGEGAHALALERLKKKLAAEGLFDAARKKDLPRVPAQIGIVTSLDGAALRDVVRVLRRRFAGVRVLIAATPVQGSDAARRIASAVTDLDGRRLDVLMLVRGGGAREDLAAFDAEGVVRAIAAAETPVVTGIGHEIDVTLADLAADLRAPTPSAAAEVVIRERSEMLERLRDLQRLLHRAMRLQMKQHRLRLLEARRAEGLRSFPSEVERKIQHLADLERRIETAWQRRLETARTKLRSLSERLSPARRQARLADRRRELAQCRTRLEAHAMQMLSKSRRRLAAAAAGLDALSPLAVLERGYALAHRESREGPLIVDARTVKRGERIFLRFARGEIVARAETVSRPSES